MIDFYIINEFDKPCRDLIVYRKNDTGKYIDKTKREEYTFNDFSRAVNLQDFGFTILENDLYYLLEKNKQTIAKYPDGKLRQWQDNNLTIKIFKSDL